MTSNLTISTGAGEASSDGVPAANDQDHNREINYGGGGMSEIEEVLSSEPSNGSFRHLESIREDIEGGFFPSDFDGGGDDAVYVAVGTQSEEASMDALIWALNNPVIPSSTLVFLIHVFPETKYIPTPLGKLPISQVNPEQKQNYMAQERAKRRDFLQKFLNVCSASQVKVDTILIESDMEAKAILELIPILNVRKLVLGTTKSNLRRTRPKRGNGVTEQILQNAPDNCEIKIICEGKEMSELPPASPSPSPSPRPTTDTDAHPKFAQNEDESVACGCFKI